MKVALIHFSDAHLSTPDDVIQLRMESAVNAVRATCPDLGAWVTCFVGDVANTGSKDEYALGELLLESLSAAVRQQFNNIAYSEVHVPGNHDCDFRGSNQLRDVALRSILDGTEKGVEDSKMADACTAVQDNYFDFLCKQMREPRHRRGLDRLFWKIEKEFGGFKISFLCVNTAWMSKLKERQGELVPFAGSLLEEQPSDLVVTLFHHPYNWQKAEFAREFKKQYEQVSQLVLTGHEHDPSTFDVTNPQGKVSKHVEGGLLHHSSTQASSFHAIIVDTQERVITTTTYVWEKNLYVPNEGQSLPIKKLAQDPNKPFHLTRATEKMLSDPGANYLHPVKGDLKLEDFYTPPQLEFRTERKGSGKTERVVESSHHHFEYPTIILGEDSSGKTSLAFYLFRSFEDKGKSPIMLKGRDLRKFTANKLKNLIDKTITETYGVGAVNPFRQLLPESRVLIVDDLDEAQLNRNELNNLLEELKLLFSKIILFANPLFPVEQHFQQSDLKNSLLALDCLRISPFGHKMRGRLISRWYSIGKSADELDGEFHKRVGDAEEFVKNLLGSSLLPRYPTFILALLQNYETHTNSSVTGTFGFHYEKLVKNAVATAYAACGAKAKDVPEDALEMLAALIAYQMFQSKLNRITREEFADVLSEYRKRFGKTLYPESVLPLLDESGFLIEKEEGVFGFKYDYAQRFYLATYLARHLHQEKYAGESRRIIDHLVNRLHVEAYANTLIFLIYLTKDNQTLAAIIHHAKDIFRDYNPCDIRNDVRLFNELESCETTMAFTFKSPGVHLEEYREAAEEQEKAELATNLHHDEQTPDTELEDVLKLNVAFRTIQVLGQVLKNSPGSLDVDIKRDATEECFLLSLRSLSFLNRLLSDNIDVFRSMYTRHIRNQSKVIREDLIQKEADSQMFALSNVVSYGIIKKVSMAVGSEHLDDTFKDIGDLEAPVALRLINTAIKLDHFRTFPRVSIENLAELTRSESNYLAFNVLRMLAIDHFAMVNRNADVRTSVCRLLNIQQNQISFLAPEEKAKPK